MQNTFLVVLVMLVAMHPITASNTKMQCTPVYLSDVSSNSRPADLMDEYLLDKDFSGIQCCCSLSTRKKDRLGSAMDNGRYCNIMNIGSRKLFFVKVSESCIDQNKPRLDIEVYKELCLTCKDSYPTKDSDPSGLLCCIRAPSYSCQKFLCQMRDRSTLDLTSVPSISTSRTARIERNGKKEYERLARNLKSITPIIEMSTSSRAKQTWNIKVRNPEGDWKKTILLRRLLSSIINPKTQLEVESSSKRRRRRIVDKRFKRGAKRRRRRRRRRRKRATTKSFISGSAENSQTNKEKVAYLDTLRLLNTSFSPEIKVQLTTDGKGDTESTKASHTTKSLHKEDITENRIQVKQSSSTLELPGDTDITFNFASTLTTLATKNTEPFTGTTDEYGETEEFYNEEYAEEDYADYEDKSTTFTPTWYDYETPEDITTWSIKGETTTWETEFKKPLASTIPRGHPTSTTLAEKIFTATEDEFLEKNTETTDLQSFSTSIKDNNVYTISTKENPMTPISLRTTTVMSTELRSTKGNFTTTTGTTVNETRKVDTTGASPNGMLLFTILPASTMLTESSATVNESISETLISEDLTREETRSVFESTWIAQTEEFETEETEIESTSGTFSTSLSMQINRETSISSEEFMTTTITKPETSSSISASEETEYIVPLLSTNAMYSRVTASETPRTSMEITSKKTESVDSDMTEEMSVVYTTESPTSRVFFTEATTVKSPTQENQVSESSFTIEIESSSEVSTVPHSTETVISDEEKATLLISSSIQTTTAPATTRVLVSSLREVVTERTEESVETDVESRTESSESGFEKVPTEAMEKNRETSSRLEGTASTEYISSQGTSRYYIISEATSIEAAPRSSLSAVEITFTSIETEPRIAESTSITPSSDSLGTKKASIGTTRLIVEGEPEEYIDFTTGLQGTLLSLTAQVTSNKSFLKDSTVTDQGLNSRTISDSSSVTSVSQSGRPETILTDMSTHQSQETTRTTVVERQMFKSTQPNAVSEYETHELGNITVSLSLPVEYTTGESSSTEDTLTKNTPLRSSAFTNASSDTLGKTKRITQVPESFSENLTVSNVTPDGRENLYTKTERMTSLFASITEGENTSEYEVESSDKFLKSSTLGISSSRESESSFDQEVATSHSLSTTAIDDKTIQESVSPRYSTSMKESLTSFGSTEITESSRIITESSTLDLPATIEAGINSKEGSTSSFATFITENPKPFEMFTATAVSSRITGKGKPGSTFQYYSAEETFSMESTFIPVTTAKYGISETSKGFESSSQITLTEESIATSEFENSFTLVEETGSDSTKPITTTSSEITLSTPLFQDTTDNESSLEETISTPHPFTATSLIMSSSQETEISHFTTVENITQIKMSAEVTTTTVNTLSTSELESVSRDRSSPVSSEENVRTTVTETTTYETSESSGSVDSVSENMTSMLNGMPSSTLETGATEFFSPGISTKMTSDSESRSTETLTNSASSSNTQATEITTVKGISSSFSPLTLSISTIKEGQKTESPRTHLDSSVLASSTEESLQSSTTSSLYIQPASSRSAASSFATESKDSESTINPSSLLTTESEGEFQSSTIRGTTEETTLSITGSSDKFDEEVRGTSSTVGTTDKEVPEENVKTSHYKEDTKDNKEVCDSTDIVSPIWYDYEEENVMTEASITTKKPSSKTHGTKRVSQTTRKSLLIESSSLEDIDETSTTSIASVSTGSVETGQSSFSTTKLNTMRITSSRNSIPEIVTSSTNETVGSSSQLTASDNELHGIELETVSFSTEEYTLPPTEVASVTTAPLPLDDTTENESNFLAKPTGRTTEFPSSPENDVSSGTGETDISTESTQSTSLRGEESTADTFDTSRRESVTLAHSTETLDTSLIEYSTATTMSSTSLETSTFGQSTKYLKAEHKTNATDDWISEEMPFETRSSIDFGDDHRTTTTTTTVVGKGSKTEIVNELKRLQDQEKEVDDKEEELRRKEIEWEKEREKLQKEIEQETEVSENTVDRIETTRGPITATWPDRLTPGDMGSTIWSMDLESVSETGSRSDTTSLKDLSSTIQIFTVPTIFASTTKADNDDDDDDDDDTDDEEIRALRRRLHEKEEELKERERRLLEREKRLEKEKLEFEMQLKKVKADEKVHQGEETEITMESTFGTVATSLESEEAEETVGSVSVRASSPFVSPTPPTERSTINIWESTFARDASLTIENCTTSATDLEKGSSVSDEGENEEFHEVKDETENYTTTSSYEEKSQSTTDHTVLSKLRETGTTEETREELVTKKMCLNVLEDLPSGNRADNFVTQKICLPFHFAKQEMAAGDGNGDGNGEGKAGLTRMTSGQKPEEESSGIKYTKIDQLGEHEWEENTTGHGPRAETTRIKRDVSNFAKEKQDWSYTDYTIRKNRRPLWEETDSSNWPLCEDKLITEAEYHVSWDSIPEDGNPDPITREAGLIDRNPVTGDPSWKFSPITEAEIHRLPLYENTTIIKPGESDLSVPNEKDFAPEFSFQTDTYQVGTSTVKPFDYSNDLVNGEIKETDEKQLLSRFLAKREDDEKKLDDQTMTWVVEERTSSPWHDQESRTRMTPGPQWPTERVTAYHVGGTKTWNLEFPDTRHPLEPGSRLNQGSVDGTSTCVYVIVQDYTEEEDHEGSESS